MKQLKVGQAVIDASLSKFPNGIKCSVLKVNAFGITLTCSDPTHSKKYPHLFFFDEYSKLETAEY